MMPKLMVMSSGAANATLNHPDFRRIMEEETFDFLISGFFLNNFHTGLAAHFKCPFAILVTGPAMLWTNQYLGQPTFAEAVPNIFSGLHGELNFKERLVNMYYTLREYFFTIEYEDYQRELYNSNFPNPTYPSYDDVKKNVSLILTNDYLTAGKVRPNLPTLVQIGGIQIKSKPSPLPADIQTWIDEAEDGAIFVSFGTNYKASEVETEKLQALINSLGKLKERVLWKYETNETQMPGNVLIRDWLPQSDILAHPKIKVFVSHCGASSINEALYHAVPVVAIPFASDQPLNAKKIADQGWAQVIPFLEMTETKLDAALNDVINDLKYKNNAQYQSNLYRDRPLSAMESAIYWIEYVIRHNGATHLQGNGRDLYWWQQISLDVILFIAIWIYGIVWVLNFAFESAIRFFKPTLPNNLVAVEQKSTGTKNFGKKTKKD